MWVRLKVDKVAPIGALVQYRVKPVPRKNIRCGIAFSHLWCYLSISPGLEILEKLPSDPQGGETCHFWSMFGLSI